MAAGRNGGVMAPGKGVDQYPASRMETGELAGQDKV
jgi:hypothetical protein